MRTAIGPAIAQMSGVLRHAAEPVRDDALRFGQHQGVGGARFGFEASSFFVDEGNAPRIGQAFLLIDAGALAGREVYNERIETLVAEMLGDNGVRLAGSRRAGLEAQARQQGITISEALRGQLEQLAAGG